MNQGRSFNEINLPAEPEAREIEVDSLLVDRVARFLATHTLQFKVPKDSIEDLQTSLEEGKNGNRLSLTKNRIFNEKVDYVTYVDVLIKTG